VLCEDEWHAYSGQRTSEIVLRYLKEAEPPKLLLNAGAGVHKLDLPGWDEIALDLFPNPLRNHRSSVCASVEAMPFDDAKFDAVVCVGEVLGYCDPARAIREFSRVLSPNGILICDFESTLSWRYWATSVYGRAAEIVTDFYNGSTEQIWAYHPNYITNLLTTFGFSTEARLGTHNWSPLALRIGASRRTALSVEKALRWSRLSLPWADLQTIVGIRSEVAKELQGTAS
jgi:SAM-dependent methyltransferase